MGPNESNGRFLSISRFERTLQEAERADLQLGEAVEARKHEQAMHLLRP
jgi:hypothetical protein